MVMLIEWKWYQNRYKKVIKDAVGFETAPSFGSSLTEKITAVNRFSKTNVCKILHKKVYFYQYKLYLFQQITENIKVLWIDFVN